MVEAGLAKTYSKLQALSPVLQSQNVHFTSSTDLTASSPPCCPGYPARQCYRYSNTVLQFCARNHFPLTGKGTNGDLLRPQSMGILEEFKWNQTWNKVTAGKMTEYKEKWWPYHHSLSAYFHCILTANRFFPWMPVPQPASFVLSFGHQHKPASAATSWAVFASLLCKTKNYSTWSSCKNLAFLTTLHHCWSITSSLPHSDTSWETLQRHQSHSHNVPNCVTCMRCWQCCATASELRIIGHWHCFVSQDVKLYTNTEYSLME